MNQLNGEMKLRVHHFFSWKEQDVEYLEHYLGRRRQPFAIFEGYHCLEKGSRAEVEFQKSKWFRGTVRAP